MNTTPPTDGGPIYFETNLDAVIAEPFNMASAAIFIFIAFYWFWQIHGEYKKHIFLAIATPLLLIGGVGGTLYHGFRASSVALKMDWVPILLLCVMATAYFIREISESWKPALIVVIGLFTLEWLNYRFIPDAYAINISYGMMASTVLIPTYLVLKKVKFNGWPYIAGALGAFAVALLCRILDSQGLIPVGTHFLWHVFGAIACHLMFAFVWRLEERDFHPEFRGIAGFNKTQ